MATTTGKNEPQTAPARGSAMTFAECAALCPHRKDYDNLAGGTESECTHPEQCGAVPPCIAYVCPIFRSDDEKGDYENMRYSHEIEGTAYLP